MVTLMISSNRWLSEVNRAAYPLARGFYPYSTVMSSFQCLGNVNPIPFLPPARTRGLSDW
jgi:hypothetical protein